MSKIFGEKHFIDNTMIDLIEDYNNKLDGIVFDEMAKTIKYKMSEIKVDEQKLRDWVSLCMKLENIDKSDLIDIAVKKKFADKDDEIRELQKQMKEKDKEILDWKDGTMICSYEKMLAEKDKEIEKVETYYKSREKNIVKDVNEIIKKLKRQLTKKKNKIKKLKEDSSRLRKLLNFTENEAGIDVNEFWGNLFLKTLKEKEKLNCMIETLPNHDTEIEQQIRKQICDEIRDKLPYYKYSFQEPEVPRVDVIEIRDMEFILDKIEQGEGV